MISACPCEEHEYHYQADVLNDESAYLVENALRKRSLVYLTDS